MNLDRVRERRTLMLRIYSSHGDRFCDGLSRRSFLEIGAFSGGLAMGGFSFADLLRTEHDAGRTGSHKAIINVFLPGGPPHQDMFDLKPEAPREIRGELRPIRTSVPGIEICELFPRLARIAEDYAIIRTVVGATGDHYSFQCFTGRTHQRQPPGGWPSIGSVLSKLHGPVHPGVPSFVGLSPRMGHVPWSDPGGPGFTGPAHAPFQPNGAGSADLTLDGITLERLRDRAALLSSFDRFRRASDSAGNMEGMDGFQRQALGVLTSSRLADALDLEQEAPAVRDRYGRGTPDKQDDGGPKLLDQFLLARRLVEAGVRCVTLAYSRWDWHGDNFGSARYHMPMLDQGVSALIEDLRLRGLDKDVTVIVWGEFGRTPQINKDGGRDHWPQVSCALIAGGGLRTGQVIGTTGKHAEAAKDRPVHFQEIFATLYHALGLDPLHTTIEDLTGRPRFLVDTEYRPIAELV
jgi:hypothetical protein